MLATKTQNQFANIRPTVVRWVRTGQWHQTKIAGQQLETKNDDHGKSHGEDEGADERDIRLKRPLQGETHCERKERPGKHAAGSEGRKPCERLWQRRDPHCLGDVCRRQAILPVRADAAYNEQLHGPAARIAS
jgi:hypothetical protein